MPPEKLQRNRPMHFEYSEKDDVNNVKVSFTSEMREPRDVDGPSGDDEVTDNVQVKLDGEFETAFPWDESLADKTSEEYTEKKDLLENDLKNILEADDDIEKVELTDCEFTKAENSRRKRDTESAMTQANYSLSVTGTSLNATQTAATNTIKSADPANFSSLSTNSAASYIQQAREIDTNTTVPNVTEITNPVETSATTEATTPASTTATTLASTTAKPTPAKPTTTSESPDVSSATAAVASIIISAVTLF